jgi:hypothetical protein
MKVSDILENNDNLPDRATTNVRQVIGKARAVPGHKPMGWGVNAYVYKNATPDEMDNVKRISSTSDPTVAYLLAIHNDSTLHNNPFLPRIHKVNSPGKDISEIQMEKLYPLKLPELINDQDQLLMKSLWEQYFITPYPHQEEHPVLALDSLSYKLNQAVVNSSYLNINDKQLIKALKFVKQFIDNSVHIKLHSDIHNGNLMWRITGNKPQLVIVDPLLD